MQKTIPTAEQATTPALSHIPEPVCKYPGHTSCRGCEYSFAPDLYDGGCLAGYSPEERQRIRNTATLPPRRV